MFEVVLVAVIRNFFEGPLVESGGVGVLKLSLELPGLSAIMCS